MSAFQVLVEYDDEEWTTREWLKIHDGSWKLFLVEQTMVWSQRQDPSNPKRPLLWPALVRELCYIKAIFFMLMPGKNNSLSNLCCAKFDIRININKYIMMKLDEVMNRFTSKI